MLSVNQMAVYHTVMEAYNIITKNASDQLTKKLKMHQRLRIPLIIAITFLIFVQSNQIGECDVNYTTVTTRKARGRLGNHIWALMGM